MSGVYFNADPDGTEVLRIIDHMFIVTLPQQINVCIDCGGWSLGKLHVALYQ